MKQVIFAVVAAMFALAPVAASAATTSTTQTTTTDVTMSADDCVAAMNKCGADQACKDALVKNNGCQMPN